MGRRRAASGADATSAAGNATSRRAAARAARAAHSSVAAALAASAVNAKSLGGTTDHDGRDGRPRCTAVPGTFGALASASRRGPRPAPHLRASPRAARAGQAAAAPVCSDSAARAVTGGSAETKSGVNAANGGVGGLGGDCWIALRFRRQRRRTVALPPIRGRTPSRPPSTIYIRNPFAGGGISWRANRRPLNHHRCLRRRGKRR